MKYRILASFCALAATLTPCLATAGGTETGGGGQGVIYPNGAVRIVDYLRAEDLPPVPASDDQIISSFYAKNRFVRQAAEDAPQFWDAARRILSPYQDGYPVLKNGLEALALSRPVLLQIRFAREASQVSPSVAAPFQEPLARYAESRLGINARLYAGLDTEDREGLSVHEAFRNMNYFLLGSRFLSTPQIEALTRYFTGHDHGSDPTILNLALDKLRGGVQADSDVKVQLAEVRRKWSELQQSRLSPGLSAARQSELTKESFDLDAQEDVLILSDITRLVGNVTRTSKAFEGNLLATFVTTVPLPDGLRWDSLENKTVSWGRSGPAHKPNSDN